MFDLTCPEASNMSCDMQKANNYSFATNLMNNFFQDKAICVEKGQTCYNKCTESCVAPNSYEPTYGIKKKMVELAKDAVLKAPTIYMDTATKIQNDMQKFINSLSSKK